MAKNDSVPQKKCTRCGVEQPVTNFYKDRYSNSGYANWDKECTKLNRREADKRAKHNREVSRALGLVSV
jgi:hypothetical protein